MAEEHPPPLPKWIIGVMTASVVSMAGAGWIEACTLRDDLQAIRIEWEATKGLTAQQETDRRLIRLEEWRRDMERFQTEGGRCTREQCDNLGERIHVLDRRITRLE